MRKIQELDFDNLNNVDIKQIINFGAHLYRVVDSDRNVIFESDNEHELEEFIQSN